MPAMTAQTIGGAMTMRAALRPTRQAGGSMIAFRICFVHLVADLDAERLDPPDRFVERRLLADGVDWNHIWQPPAIDDHDQGHAEPARRRRHAA